MGGRRDLISRGKLITLEGGEGGGKSTQSLALGRALASAGIPIIRTREPGGAPGSEVLRTALLSRGWDPVAELALHFAARREHWARTIVPALGAGVWVLCDRFFDSTWAYQVAGQGAPARAFELLREATLGDAAPDLTLLLDLPEGAGLARARDPNRYEALGAAFHARVRAGFRARASAEPGRFVILDATRPPEAVTEAALAAIRDRLLP